MSILYILNTIIHNLSCSVWGDTAVDEHHYFSLGSNDTQYIIVRLKNYIVDEGRRATVLQHLRQQLEIKNMIYSKDKIQLSSTVGQGIVS